MKLNCDLGESFGAWTMGLDSEVMPYIDQANIACGFHGGDPLVMQKTLALAKQYQVSVGAHPSYPDLVGFGRRSMACSSEQIIALIHYQVAALDGMAKVQGLTVDYVKPHGALYNDMMVKPEVFNAILTALAQYPKKLTLMLQATADLAEYKKQASKLGVDVYSEAFADRCYDDKGRLLARSQAGAVLTKPAMLAQVKQLSEQGSVTTISGKVLKLSVDSLCVHGDNISAVQAIREIKDLMR
ncbi:5-oxoprolinase subunit PxpA [Colwellia psychrerythraea]|uniref:LamB/YcsF family protein n=1 Tax=Colwellia psychrerythraea TaxID=28229 RepID=A0A099KIZ0_COLPS|nr:5-oxoprolinase subunit PxpA [Colwellia psychrerythraea]KGJ89947.1 LamB/YcsF family protein [Colwellia psychrerythraea]